MQVLCCLCKSVEGWICVRALRALMGLNDQPYLGPPPIRIFSPCPELRWRSAGLFSSHSDALPGHGSPWCRPQPVDWLPGLTLDLLYHHGISLWLGLLGGPGHHLGRYAPLPKSGWRMDPGWWHPALLVPTGPPAAPGSTPCRDQTCSCCFLTGSCGFFLVWFGLVTFLIKK